MGIRICPDCGGKVSTSRNDCIHCGYIFPATKKCPDCEALVPLEATMCPECGYSFVEEPKKPEVKQEAAVAPIVQETAAPQPAPKQETAMQTAETREPESVAVSPTEEQANDDIELELEEEPKTEVTEPSTEPVVEEETELVLEEVPAEEPTPDEMELEAEEITDQLDEVEPVAQPVLEPTLVESGVVCPYCSSTDLMEMGINYYICCTCNGRFLDTNAGSPIARPVPVEPTPIPVVVKEEDELELVEESVSPVVEEVAPAVIVSESEPTEEVASTQAEPTPIPAIEDELELELADEEPAPVVTAPIATMSVEAKEAEIPVITEDNIAKEDNNPPEEDASEKKLLFGGMGGRKRTPIIIGAVVLAILLVAGTTTGITLGVKNSRNPVTTYNCSNGHTYGAWYKTKEATCTEKGEMARECQYCNDKQTKVTSKKSHDYVEAKDEYIAPTCEKDGTKYSRCSACGARKSELVPALGHNWVEIERNEATCERGGQIVQQCSRCKGKQTSDISALGHIWGETVWTEEPTCLTGGVGAHNCMRCGETENVSERALGHELRLVDSASGGSSVYSCERNGCKETYLRFNVADVTEESKKHLTISEDGGASFWGRPIGNNLELDESGISVNQTVGELVFDETQTGDYFELKFDLTATQANKLKNCMMYCEAKAAPYMSNNRMDFWARGADSSDWTPGAYIEGEKKGTIITDYRYVLYVDGVRKDFDPTISVPAKASTVRTEYVLPYTFNLHKATNTIRLAMAGGFRSTFYNFTFRPVEEKPVDPGTDPVDPPAPAHTHGAVTATGEVVTEDGCCPVKSGKCECDADAKIISAAADLNGNITREGGKLPKGSSTGRYDGTAIASYKFKASAGKAHILAKVSVDNTANCSETNGYSYYTGKASGETQKVLSDGTTNTVMTVNGETITMPTTTYYEMGIKGMYEADCGIADFGEFTLVDGVNEFTLAGTNSYGLNYYEFYII